MNYYIETYGCQMNEADSELVSGLLDQIGGRPVADPNQADLIMVNSCSVRHNAERRALARLSQFKTLKKQNPSLKLGLIGCVAQQQRNQILIDHPHIDIVLGPDAYRRIADIVHINGDPLIDVKLSRRETYDCLEPHRRSAISAYVSIMRGCDHFCSFCIVPFTRGRERSRPADSIRTEIIHAVEAGFQEVTLLGQNVNSYHHGSDRFPELLETVSAIPGIRRIRFTSPHPANINEKMLHVMRARDNICKQIHLPMQSGATPVLKMMNRNYDQEHYLRVVDTIRRFLPEVTLTTDIIVGFPRETEADFEETLNVMDAVIFDGAFMFKYSPRPGTRAARLPDDVSPEIKSERLNRVIAKQKLHTRERNRALIGTTQTILIESSSKKNPIQKMGRTDGNKIVIVTEGDPAINTFTRVKITRSAGVTLFGIIT